MSEGWVIKIGSFKFNPRELSGSMGNFGTLLLLAVGYIAVCGLNPPAYPPGLPSSTRASSRLSAAISYGFGSIPEKP